MMNSVNRMEQVPPGEFKEHTACNAQTHLAGNVEFVEVYHLVGLSKY